MSRSTHCPTPPIGGTIIVMESLPQYHDWMQMRGLSPATIKRRLLTLRQFGRWIAPLPIAQADIDHVETWLQSKVAANTRAAYLSDLAAYYRWANRRGLCATNPAALIDSIRTPRPVPRPVPAELVPALVQSCPHPRLRLALTIAAYAGLRRAEICALTIDDVRRTRPATLTVRAGKGGRGRVVPAHPAILAEIDAQEPWTREELLVPWQPDTLGRHAARWLEANGLHPGIHRLRASMATDLARLLHGDVLAVGRVLGHASPTTTMGYVAVADPDVDTTGLYGDVA